MHLRCFLVTLAAALCAAAPAFAQQGSQGIPSDAPVCSGVGDTTTSCATAGDPTAGEGTVGSGQVITDPASEIEEPPPADDSAGETGPTRGELRALGAREEGGTASSQEPQSAAAPVGSPATSRAVAAVAPGDDPAVAARQATSADTLPFTGVDAGPLALLGLMMLAGGLGLRRAARSAV